MARTCCSRVSAFSCESYDKEILLPCLGSCTYTWCCGHCHRASAANCGGCHASGSVVTLVIEFDAFVNIYRDTGTDVDKGCVWHMPSIGVGVKILYGLWTSTRYLRLPGGCLLLESSGDAVLLRSRLRGTEDTRVCRCVGIAFGLEALHFVPRYLQTPALNDC